VVRAEFDNFLGSIGAFYERKVRPTERTVDIWYGKIKKIPSEAVPWIERRIQDECEGWPRNITATMWAYFHAWLDSHPEKRELEKKYPCSECQGEGLLFGNKKSGSGIRFRYVFRCAVCGQSPLLSLPKINKSAMLGQGFEVLEGKN
jgi:hypothetical protein